MELDLSSAIKLLAGVKDMPRLGFGTYHQRGETVRASTAAAIAAGARHIDTATAYRNEEAVGAAIAASGVPREELFIVAKVFLDDADVEAAARASVAKLGVGYADVLLLHWPAVGTGDYHNNADGAVEVLPYDVGARWAAMERCVEAGVARAAGLANHTWADVEKVLAVASQHRPVINQVENHPLLWAGYTRDLAEKCRAEGIVVYSCVAASASLKKTTGLTPCCLVIRVHTLPCRIWGA